jgi:hypothetical protein
MPPKQASVNYDIKDKEVIKPCKKKTHEILKKTLTTKYPIVLSRVVKIFHCSKKDKNIFISPLKIKITSH